MSVVYRVSPDLWLDARRAAWFPTERVIAVADLHLGYAWAHRAAGQLMPLGAKDDTADRLLALHREYDAREIAFLGDIVHRAIPITGVEAELRALVTGLPSDIRLTFLAGNHDRNLEKTLKHWRMDLRLADACTVGPYTLIHGDQPPPDASARGRVMMGHEHPSITLGDGVTTTQKCPCFLVSDELIVLPAFSRWAAGTNIRAYPFASELARNARFTKAVAICGSKLLPVPLQR